MARRQSAGQNRSIIANKSFEVVTK